ncbi:integrase, catalytic region, zinc finger, CCHC-type containing protein [Tanacetum coccineum]
MKEQFTNVDDDVDISPENDCHSMWTISLKLMKVNAFNSDVTEGPSHRTKSMTNLTPKDRVQRMKPGQHMTQITPSEASQEAPDFNIILYDQESGNMHIQEKDKKQVTFSDKPGTSSSNTQKHKVHQRVQQTNIPMIPSTGVNDSTEASRSKPRSNTKENRILPAKKENKKEVEAKSCHLTKLSGNVVSTLNANQQEPQQKLGEPEIPNSPNSGLFSNAGRTGHALVSGLRLFKHMSGRIVSKHKNFCENAFISRIKVVRFGNDHLGAIIVLIELCYEGDSVVEAPICTTISFDECMKSSPICLLSKASKSKSWLWHRRLNHLNFGTINDLARKDLVRGVGIFHQSLFRRTPSSTMALLKDGNRTLFEAARTMMNILEKAPMFLWAEGCSATLIFHSSEYLVALCYPTNDSGKSKERFKPNKQHNLGFSDLGAINAQIVPPSTTLSTTDYSRCTNRQVDHRQQIRSYSHPVQHQEIAEEPSHEDTLINHDVLHPLHNPESGDPGSAQSSFGNVNSAEPIQVYLPTRSSQKN